MEDNVIDFDTAKILAGDHMVRGVAADGMIRAFAITAKETVQTAHENHNTSPLVTAALGRLMMGGLMMGSMSKDPNELISLVVQGDGPIEALTVTVDTAGHVKGFANQPNVWLPPNDQGKLDVGSGIGQGTLSVVHDVPHIEPYSSQVELVSGEIGDDLTSYFAISDQIPTSVGVGVLVNKDTSVKQAGGFIIQLMPGYYEYLTDELEANLQGVTSVTSLMEDGLTPTQILEKLLEGMDFKVLDVMPVSFRCDCSEDRAIRSAVALGEVELRDIIEKGETAEVFCHFCGKRYYLTPQKLAQMIVDMQG